MDNVEKEEISYLTYIMKTSNGGPNSNYKIQLESIEKGYNSHFNSIKIWNMY